MLAIGNVFTNLFVDFFFSSKLDEFYFVLHHPMDGVCVVNRLNKFVLFIGNEC